MAIPKKLRDLLEKQQYGFVGNHSAVKICSWAKKSLLGEGECYKAKFYGIKSHRCCQMTPSVGFCQNRCIICWRPVEHTVDSEMCIDVLDEPKEIISKVPEAQRKLLSGFGGNPKADMKKHKEMKDPLHYAISLAGEPTLYPKLNKLIKELHSKGKTTFVVTNGMEPEVLEKIEPPTQLYVSIDAPTEELLKKIDKPVHKDAWQRLNKSLSVLKKLGKKTRTALRITLVVGMNMVYPEKYAEMIEKADPMFVEVKAFMFVGGARTRKGMTIKNMPRHPEIREFSEKILKHCKYKIIDEQPRSRVVLMMKKDSKSRFLKF